MADTNEGFQRKYLLNSDREMATVSQIAFWHVCKDLID